ncbi:MAG: hypothetical protein M8364_17340 [Methylobacter sp.]|uniref:hypothetical protein n=1 Tax=Methylobacter sp. TaxID=2051955 RepID=UPI002583E566|nr:hypothetical protein [Methylobacter sp.]MCL7422657.1 hypothetical protein [Methylobacter sp.]
MIKKFAYILIPACAAISVAEAETMQSSPTLLTAGEMDQVTAGSSIDVDAGAIAISNVLALTKTTTAAITVAGGDNPKLPGGGFAVGGLAQASAVGDGAAADTSVTPTVGITGSNVHSIQVDVKSSGSISNLSGSAIVAVIAPTALPF